MNSTIIDCFNKLIIKSESQNENKFKIISYKKIISIISKLDFEITSITQLKDIKNIGPSSLKRIQEIIDTKTLTEIENVCMKSMDKETIIKDLMKITGIGKVKATKLYSNNISLELLLESYKTQNIDILNNLTHHQIIGVKYYYDLEKRIPYNEITQINNYLNSIISTIDKNLNITICGSYRRKKETSGDIDILITHNKIKTDKNLNKTDYLKQLINILTHNKFLVDNLTYNGNTKYMGLCKYLDNPPRRIDIRFIPLSSYPTSLLYFTGSGEFNKNMRTYAIKHKYKLNEYELSKIVIDNETEIKTKIKNINSEEDIFKELNLKYVGPQNRSDLYNFDL
jgi:DNA polymerase/3'-5' exonuclease PolX